MLKSKDFEGIHVLACKNTIAFFGLSKDNE
jgi:peroxiredoxin family protein